MKTFVLGIDPGQKDTGAVVRQGDLLLASMVISHHGWETRPVIDELWNLTRAFRFEGSQVVIGVEGINQPSGFQKINWLPLLSTAAVLGAVMATWPDALVVPPGGHGSDPLWAYPKELVGARETTGTSGRLGHARSAWDVAGVVPRLLAMGAHAGGR